VGKVKQTSIITKLKYIKTDFQISGKY